MPAKDPDPLWRDYLDVSAALEAPPPELDFVLPGLVGGTMGVLVSPGGAGKSMLALGLACSVAAGQDAWQLLGEDPRPGPVLIVSAEDPRPILARRFHSLRDSEPGIFHPETLANLRVKSVQGAGFALGTWDGTNFVASTQLRILEQEIRELRPRLVVFDTLNRCLAGISENDNGALGRIISEVERIVAPTSSAALVLHHTSKATALAGQGDQQQSARGAGAITDNARYQLNLVTMSPEDAEARSVSAEERRQWVRAVPTKCNYAAMPDERWLRRGPGGVLAASTPPPAVSKAKGKKGSSSDAIPW